MAAIANAIGVRMTEPPMLPPKVLEAIDGELYEIDFLRPIKPGAEVFLIPKIGYPLHSSAERGPVCCVLPTIVL
jgi:hypothetical protein